MLVDSDQIVPVEDILKFAQPVTDFEKKVEIIKNYGSKVQLEDYWKLLSIFKDFSFSKRSNIRKREEELLHKLFEPLYKALSNHVFGQYAVPSVIVNPRNKSTNFRINARSKEAVIQLGLDIANGYEPKKILQCILKYYEKPDYTTKTMANCIKEGSWKGIYDTVNIEQVSTIANTNYHKEL